MKHLKLIFTIFLVVGLTLTNCQKEETCPPFLGGYFDINGIASFVHYYRVSESSIAPAPNFSSLEFDTYVGSRIRYSVDYLSYREGVSPQEGFGSLYALSCIANGEFGSKTEKYEQINIITMNDFSDIYQAGDTINQIMEAFGLPLDEYLQTQDSTFISYKYLYLKPNQAPTAHSRFQIKVFVELSTGEKYSGESTVIEFL